MDLCIDFHYSIRWGRSRSRVNNGASLSCQQIFQGSQLVLLPFIEIENWTFVSYGQAMNDLLLMGPPVYWVLGKGISFENIQEQNIICGGPGCNNNSLATTLYLTSHYPESYVLFSTIFIIEFGTTFTMSRTSVATPSSSWIDDYIDWLSIKSCCRIHDTKQTFCPSNCKNKNPSERKARKIFQTFWIFVIAASDSHCIACPRDFVGNLTTKRPTPQTFGKYISFFLNDIPNNFCAKAGRPAYAQVILFIIITLDQQFC